MLNIANLYPEWFARVFDGSKTIERRERRDRDATLDAVQRGEYLVLRETGGSGRAVVCTIARKRCTRQRPGFLYSFSLTDVRACRVLTRFGAAPAMVQGWRRLQYVGRERAPELGQCQLVTDDAPASVLVVVPWR